VAFTCLTIDYFPGLATAFLAGGLSVARTSAAVPAASTASLGHAAGPDRLALGVEISEPMLTRAVRAEAGPQIGFLRADAQRLPLHAETDITHRVRYQMRQSKT
jgi:hypothetical protein